MPSSRRWAVDLHVAAVDDLPRAGRRKAFWYGTSDIVDVRCLMSVLRSVMVESL